MLDPLRTFSHMPFKQGGKYYRSNIAYPSSSVKRQASRKKSQKILVFHLLAKVQNGRN
jgi:hypothetical protein